MLVTLTRVLAGSSTVVRWIVDESMGPTVAEAISSTRGWLGADVWGRKSSFGSMASSCGWTRKEGDSMYNGGGSRCNGCSGDLLSKVDMVSGTLTSFIFASVDVSKTEMVWKLSIVCSRLGR
jgi:hypothetical protein